MALNPTGPISMGGTVVGESINLELGKAATATISLNDADARALAGISTGMISLSNFYGKSNTLGHYIAYSFFTKPTSTQSASANARPYQGVTWNGKTYFFWNGGLTNNSVGNNIFNPWIYNSTFTSVTLPSAIASIFTSASSATSRTYIGAMDDAYGCMVYNNNLYIAGDYQIEPSGTINTTGTVFARLDENMNILQQTCIGFRYTSGTSVNAAFCSMGLRNGNVFGAVFTNQGNTVQAKGLWELNSSTFAKISVVAPQKRGTRTIYSPTTNNGVWMAIGTNATTNPANNGIVFEFINSAGSSTGQSSPIAGFLLNYGGNLPVSDINGNLIFTAYRNASAPTTTWILAKRLQNNTLAWSKTINSAGGNNRNNGYFYPRSDNDGNIYVLWQNSQTFNFYLGAVNQPLILKFDANGNFQWCKRFIIGTNFTISSSNVFWVNDSYVNGVPIVTDGVNIGFWANDGTTGTNGILVNLRIPLDGNCNGTYTVNGRTVTIQDQAVTVGNHTWSTGTAPTITTETELYTNSTCDDLLTANFTNAITTAKLDI